MTASTHISVWTPGRTAGLALFLAVWFVAAAAAGAGGVFVNTGQNVTPPVAIMVAIPVTAFLIAYALSARFRAFVQAQDIRTLTMLQHWRVVGFAFLALYAYDALPGLFAWPAGLGDIAIGLAAPFIVARLARDPDFATSAGFVRYNLLGLLDFAVAVIAAGLVSGAFPALVADGRTSAPMDVWPLSIFPSFIVPIFIILHLTVLLKVREARRTARGSNAYSAA